METTEVLYRVKDRLFEKGWTKGALGPSEGPNCLVGAILEVLGVSLHDRDVTHIQTLDALENVVMGYLPAFNDRVETTFDDIINTIDQAIKMEGQ